jgi:hypothetical protein
MSQMVDVVLMLYIFYSEGGLCASEPTAKYVAKTETGSKSGDGFGIVRVTPARWDSRCCVKSQCCHFNQPIKTLGYILKERRVLARELEISLFYGGFVSQGG